MVPGFVLVTHIIIIIIIILGLGQNYGLLICPGTNRMLIIKEKAKKKEKSCSE